MASYDPNQDWFAANAPQNSGPPTDENGQPLGAPPNSTWNGSGWTTTAPTDPGYDPTWGGYSTGNPSTDPWLASVYANQGWNTPTANVDDPPNLPTTPTTPGGAGAPGAPGGGIQPYSGGNYTTLPRPAYLADPYVPPTWQGGDFAAPTKPDALNTPFAAPNVPTALQSPFTAPTMADVTSDPGYLTRLSAGQLALDRSAAAKGTVLSGGQQKALTRYGQDYGANEYANVFGRALNTRQQAEGEYQNTFLNALGTRNEQVGEYNANFDNAFKSYVQKYGQFVDSANMGYQARALNEGAYQSDVGNNLNQYTQRYQSYLDLINNNRTAQNDYWSQQMDLAHNALTALGYTRPANPA